MDFDTEFHCYDALKADSTFSEWDMQSTLAAPLVVLLAVELKLMKPGGLGTKPCIIS